MKIIRAKSAGLCMGVALALRKLSQSVEKKSPTSSRLVMFGPIIHNPQVMEEYKQQGVICINSIEEIKPGDTVIIRAHGIPIHEETYLNKLGVTLIDATCPKVKQAQLAIAKATTTETVLFIFGEKEHPEVKGLISYSNGPYHVFDTIHFLEHFAIPQNTKIVLAAQTTQDASVFQKLQQLLLQKNIQVTLLDTICNATHKRQNEMLSLTKKVTAMVVVGGLTSGNTRRLAELSKQNGIKTLHVETVDSLYDNDELQQTDIIGLTAGASTPQHIINDVEKYLKKCYDNALLQ